MKWFVLIMLLSASAFAVNCEKGSYEYNGGCVVDIAPEIAPPVQPSDEKPPEEKLPSYEREGTNVVDAPNMGDADAKADQDKRDAEAQGKHSAGLK